MYSILLVVVSGVSAPVPPDPNQKALEEFQGTWVATAVEEKGEAATPEELKRQPWSVVVKGNVLTLREGKGQPDQYAIKIDSAARPKTIDLTEQGDSAQPGEIHAIYSLQDGELKLCFTSRSPNKPEERPKEFATGGSKDRPQKGKIMFTLKRDGK